MKESNRKLIIGVGNRHRGDDAIGIEVVETLREKHPDLADYAFEESDLTRIIDYWEDREVVLVDAVNNPHRRLGEIFTTSDLNSLSNFSKKYSSHAFSLDEVYTLSKNLGRIPSSTYFIGVHGENWKTGQPLSQVLRNKVPQVIDVIMHYFGHPKA